MPKVSDDIKGLLEAEIAKATLASKRPTGGGVNTEYRYNGQGKLISYRVTLTMNNGLVQVFPPVQASSKPSDEETAVKYVNEVVEEIDTRRKQRAGGRIR